jgi:hypothetical protein
VTSGSLVGLALGGLGRDVLKVGIGLAVAVLLALAFAVSSLTALLGLAPTGGAADGARPGGIPPGQPPTLRAAAGTCGPEGEVPAAPAEVESRAGRNMATSPAEATGYGQYSSASWAACGRGGDPYDHPGAPQAIDRYPTGYRGGGDADAGRLGR